LANTCCGSAADLLTAGCGKLVLNGLFDFHARQLKLNAAACISLGCCKLWKLPPLISFDIPISRVIASINSVLRPASARMFFPMHLKMFNMKLRNKYILENILMRNCCFFNLTRGHQQGWWWNMMLVGGNSGRIGASPF